MRQTVSYIASNSPMITYELLCYYRTVDIDAEKKKEDITHVGSKKEIIFHF